MPTILELDENYQPTFYIPHTQPVAWPPYEDLLTFVQRQTQATNLCGLYFNDQVESLHVAFHEDHTPQIVEAEGPIAYTLGQVRALSLLSDTDFLSVTDELCYVVTYQDRVVPTDWTTIRNVYDLILTGQAIAAIRRGLIAELQVLTDAYQVQHAVDPEQATYVEYLRHAREFYAALSDIHLQALNSIRDDWDARYRTIEPPFRTHYPMKVMVSGW